ncbi:TonB-dependent receptor plug domain-containing protein [Cryomorpha ignava]|uniref:TonB-dependent receptor plug domain-containing protein n=1 Tax=Cryomorpha ignava TaxID=101383 RepID=A0A7K3WR20_9FLAO|nr:carboxypeptidase regulatory-like domain-containing protein [Cryomorpha ignava]NEN23978.1 TonB-dependent receptor plug domain-containing protein [Cryomorpha ignava]
MLRNLYLLGLVFLLSTSSLLAQVGAGTLKGKLTDSETGEPLPFVNIVLQSGDQQVAGGSTDFDGNYTIKPIPPGSYNVLISYVGYNAKRIEGVIINNSKITFLDIDMDSGIKLTEFEVVEYSVPLIDKDGGSTGGTVTREDIARMPGRSATSIAATVGGVQETSGGDISIRGARTDNTYYYIDGIKVRGSSNLPKAAIEEVSVLTGGIPANYGDATGGIIAITTRGASSQYFGSIDVLTSGFANEDGDGIGLDRFSQTQVEGVISGPLIWKKDAEGNKDKPLIGFFASGNYRDFLDGRPTIGNYRIKQSVKDQLVNNPLDFSLINFDVNPSADVYINDQGELVNATVVSPSVQGISNSEFLNSSDWEEVPARQNDRQQGVSATLKFDVATAPNFDVSFGGTYDWEKDNLYNYENSLLNAQNNGESTDQTWRAFGRFTQRFNSDAVQGEEEGLIKNAFYSIMVDYSRRERVRQDPIHKDKLFNYGYVGSFETQTAPNYRFRQDTSAFGFYQEGLREIATTFTPSEVNSDLASYTSALYNYYNELGFVPRTLNDIQAAGGLINGQAAPSVYGLYNAIGRPYNNYAFFNQNQFRITGSGSADIGDHAITLGFEFEQYTERNFGANPIELWIQARGLANRHLQEFDKSSVANQFDVNGTTFFTYDRINDLASQTTFDRNLRISLGMDPNGSELINVDGLDPDVFELDMFSADELLRQGGTSSLVNYYGYDYKGNVLTGSRPTIVDFFNERDENGVLTRPIAAFEPVYIAGYIMDKFAFDDIIFNVGVRIDRFDANQSVLKDKYVIGDARTAGEIRNADPESNLFFGELPNNVGDDWVVYVNDLQNPTAINGYRDDETWYNAQGVVISDPRAIKTASGIAPLLRDPSAVGENLTSDAFEDYKPQINVMPRVSFSFPISDEAVFFAHYDILTQRPTGQNITNPADYLFIQNLGNRAVNNPNLRPTKTIDYELGFQQVLSRSSSLKISAFYRETRDEIQARRLLEAFPVTYTSFDNFDFGTTKGLTLTYDLRRTGNITLRLAYTLQFASATGSSAGSSLNLVNSGEPNLRVIFPTDRDQRHVFVGTFDYRYGSGKDYNGPTIGGSQIFANAGLNLVGNLGTGTPYSQQQRATGEAFINTAGSPQLEGTVNGSRLPTQFRINAQIDKSFQLKFGKEGEEQKQASLNVYLLINNLLNTQNIFGVYRYTGNADDDGYLASPQFAPGIESQIDPQSFRDMYALKVATPFNYSSPRTIQLGVRLDF